MLQQHKNQFENYLGIVNVMQEEWKLKNKGACTPKTRDLQEVDKPMEGIAVQQSVVSRQHMETWETEKDKERNGLRRELQLWIDRFKNVSQQNIEPAVKNLASLRKKYNKIEFEWQREVVYLRDVQTCMLGAATQAMKTSDEGRRTDLAAALKHILSPVEQIKTEHFHKIRIIIQSLREVEGDTNVDPWELQNLKQLPETLKRDLELVGENPERGDTDLDQLQVRLEKAMKAIFENPPKQFIYLVSLGVLHLFGFSLDSFMFDHLLTTAEVENMTQQLETHFQNIEDVPNKVKPAYTLGIGLSCLEGKHTIVQYMLDELSESLCQELKVFCRSKDPVSITKLQRTVYEVLKNNGNEFSLLPLVNSLKVQMLGCRGKIIQISKTEAQDESVNHETKLILEALGLMKYYPQKLTYDDVITLGTDVYSDVDKEPTSLPELPWYFIKRVIGLDSETRENCHLPHFLENESDDDDSGGEEKNTFSAVHPLDLIYTIFLCADDFLRQELADKMAKCQYAVPFILPSVESSGENLVLHWGLKSMARTFYKHNNLVNRTLVDTEAPLIACLNIGQETSWKSKLLNKMLSPQQETFWHQGLKGGNSEQRISQGMVEVAWYLPGRHGNNKYQYPVTFVNVRQDATDSKPLCHRLSNSSAVTCVFVEDIGGKLKIFLKQTTSLENVLVVILHQKKKEKDVKEKSKELQLEFNLGKHQVIRKAAIDAVYQLLKKAVEHMITLASHFGSLSTFVMHAEDTEGIKVGDKKCYTGQMAADSILKDVDYYNNQTPGSAKDKILSCQSDLTSRQEIGSIDKELCRQRKLDENMTVQSYWYDLKETKWQLQLNQLLRPMSDSFKYFLHCLVSLDGNDKKYFLQSLKLGLNERSSQQLQPLYDEYERCRLEDESEERDRKLKKIDQKLTHGSLGIEHFFREMAVMYENISALKEKLLSNDADEILDRLASIMALLLMEGQAIEIMDGDAITVPVAWLKAVLGNIQKSQESTLFKVAVLGAQSCGKSTLLNTVFGLNFPVSSGRYTRGAYLQLVKVEEKLKDTLKCDFVAVIDSEGLMSRTKVEGTDYDNELSTFIIGLSDLTLVIIKGEGSEMHDVLPLAIHVFLRMHIVGEHQACHFVHQNMGAVDVMTKVATEIDAFVRDLNGKTLAAAKDVDQSDRYSKFIDVLHYDPRTDNTYVPGLWDGTPPMGKTNSYYSRVMAKLKSQIATNVVDMQKRMKKMCTFHEFAKRLNELWEAIKYENFVLSFKNVLAVEAHRKLSKVFDDEQWELKREIREIVQREEHVIENDIKGGNTEQTVRQLIESSLLEITNSLTSKTAEVEERITHYFQCAGCDDCNAAVTNRHLLVNSEKEFHDDIRMLKRSLTREIESTMRHFEVKMKTDTRIHELSTEMDEIRKRKVQDAIASSKAEHLTEENIEKAFKELWQDAAGDILRNAKHAERDENIEATVQMTIRSLLGADDHLYMEVKTGKGSSRCKNKHQRYSHIGDFVIDSRRDMKLTSVWARIGAPVHVNDKDIHRLQVQSNRIIEATRKYYDNNSAPPGGKQFSQRDVELLFKDVFERIASFTDERFKTTRHYRIHLVHHIEALAVAGFTDMHERYCITSSPMALLEEKKKSYHDLFLIKMGQGDAAAAFCENFLHDIILKNVEEQLSCTELLHDLRLHCGDIFRDIKSVQSSIMVDLFKENSFDLYETYIWNYEKTVTTVMSIKCREYFTEENRFKVLAATKLDEVIARIREAVDEAAQGLLGEKQFMKTFFSKIESLKILHNEASAYLELDIPDANQFANIVHRYLEGRLKTEITELIDTWDIEDQLNEKGLAEFLFKEVVGCMASCPFCQVPCDAHSGGKTQGNHSATMHRPKGLGGYRHLANECLASSDCCSSVASERTFQCETTDFKSQPYKDYHKWFPDWTIHGNTNPNVEKYWKWVFAQHNQSFAKYYSAKPAQIPIQWHRYQKAEIQKDIGDNYHVQVDASASK